MSRALTDLFGSARRVQEAKVESEQIYVLFSLKEGVMIRWMVVRPGSVYGWTSGDLTSAGKQCAEENLLVKSCQWSDTRARSVCILDVSRRSRSFGVPLHRGSLVFFDAPRRSG